MSTEMEKADELLKLVTQLPSIEMITKHKFTIDKNNNVIETSYLDGGEKE